MIAAHGRVLLPAPPPRLNRVDSIFTDVLPADVLAQSAFVSGDSPDPAPEHALFPSELSVVAGAVPGRQAEFAAVRVLARRALGRLGIPPAPLLPGRERAPIWPAGIVGSLTHVDGLRAAAVARAEDVTALGIDAEPDLPLPAGVGDVVSSEGERAHLSRLPAPGGIAWDRVLFSAKESIFKAWSPLTGRWLDFMDCDLRIEPGGDAPLGAASPTGTFTGTLLVPGAVVDGRRVDTFIGRWAVRDDFILTAVSLPRP